MPPRLGHPQYMPGSPKREFSTMANTQAFADREARMREISRNLQSAELTKLERADQITGWLKLSHEGREKVSSHVETEPQGESPEEVEGIATNWAWITRS